MFYNVTAVAPANCLVIIKLSITKKWQLPLLTAETSIKCIAQSELHNQTIILQTLEKRGRKVLSAPV
jgi:hypothetical protein